GGARQHPDPVHRDPPFRPPRGRPPGSTPYPAADFTACGKNFRKSTEMRAAPRRTVGMEQAMARHGEDRTDGDLMAAFYGGETRAFDLLHCRYWKRLCG